MRRSRADAPVLILLCLLADAAQDEAPVLPFKTGAGVIRTLTAGAFRQFAGLRLIVALRFFLGRVLNAEAARRAGGASATSAPP